MSNLLPHTLCIVITVTHLSFIHASIVSYLVIILSDNYWPSLLVSPLLVLTCFT